MEKENATEMDQVEATPAQLKDALVELTKKLTEAEKLKKATMKKLTDDINDIKYEIQETLTIMKNQESEQCAVTI